MVPDMACLRSSSVPPIDVAHDVAVDQSREERAKRYRHVDAVENYMFFHSLFSVVVVYYTIIIFRMSMGFIEFFIALSHH